ncbi:MAG: hypothetical protein ACRDN0_05410 [Trebonia sp.]
MAARAALNSLPRVPQVAVDALHAMRTAATAAATVAVAATAAVTAATAMAVAVTAAIPEARASLPVVDPGTDGTGLTRHRPSGHGRGRSATALVAALVPAVPTDVVIPMSAVVVTGAMDAVPPAPGRAAPSRIRGLPNAETAAVTGGTGPHAPKTGANGAGASRKARQGGHPRRDPRDPGRRFAGREGSRPGPRC